MKITVVGLGVIGGSFVKALKGQGYEVYGIDTNQQTLDMAKEISMIQRSEKGKQARQYFINCEKKLKEVVKKPLTTLEQLKLHYLALEEQNKELKQVKADVTDLKNNFHQSHSLLLHSKFHLGLLSHIHVILQKRLQAAASSPPTAPCVFLRKNLSRIRQSG